MKLYIKGKGKFLGSDAIALNSHNQNISIKMTHFTISINLINDV